MNIFNLKISNFKVKTTTGAYIPQYEKGTRFKIIHIPSHVQQIGDAPRYPIDKPFTRWKIGEIVTFDNDECLENPQANERGFSLKRELKDSYDWEFEVL